MIGSPSTNPSTNFIPKLYPMSTETKKPKARVIAFYLPQFHPFKENDEWWGKGYTEWISVARARKLFPGHEQPKLPGELGFYDLRLPETREAQAAMAQKYGVDGFCYYYYRLRKGCNLMDRPLKEVLASGKPDFPFMLCWANHDWMAKSWNNTDKSKVSKMLVKQEYGGVDDIRDYFAATGYYSLIKIVQDFRNDTYPDINLVTRSYMDNTDFSTMDADVGLTFLSPKNNDAVVLYKREIPCGYFASPEYLAKSFTDACLNPLNSIPSYILPKTLAVSAILSFLPS